MTKEEAIKILTGYMGGKIDPESIELYHAIELVVDILESQPSLPSNLDEAAKEIGTDILGKDYLSELDEDCAIDALNEAITLVKAGAEWMAGQFQKIDGSLVDWYETNGVDYCHGISTNESFEVPEGFYIRKK